MEGLQIEIWGTRGSFPAPEEDRMRYGGNTLCVSASLTDRILVLDAGSGLAALGETLVKEGGARRIDLFLGHLHLDHVIGLLNFPPLFDPRAEIHLYGREEDGHPFRESLESLLREPWWPVGFSDYGAKVCWHGLRAGESGRLSEELSFFTMSANHPGGGLLYRFEAGNKSFFYGLDCEMDETVWGELVAFAGKCDLLICDGQFEESELREKAGWGHSSWERAVRLGRETGAGRVLITHHAWGCTDGMLEVRERAARRADTRCIFAREGMRIEV